jgi:hypothetical protein
LAAPRAGISPKEPATTSNATLARIVRVLTIISFFQESQSVFRFEKGKP